MDADEPLSDEELDALPDDEYWHYVINRLRLLADRIEAEERRLMERGALDELQRGEPDPRRQN